MQAIIGSSPSPDPMSSAPVERTRSGRFDFGAVERGRFAATPDRPESPSPAFDPKATRLAAGATRPTAPLPPPRADAIGNASAVPAMRAPAGTGNFPEPTVEAAPASAAPRSFVLADGVGFERQLDAFMRWALTLTGLSRAFIADREGLLIGAFPPERAQLAAAEMLAAAVCPTFERALATMQATEHALPRGQVMLERTDGPLAMVWTNAPHGRVFVGLVGLAAPSPQALQRVADALRRLLTS